MERVLRLALFATFVALPFSTSRDSALGGVLPFALPVLAAFAVLYGLRVVLSRRIVVAKQGRTQDAVTYFAKALKADPSDELAQQMMLTSVAE